MVKKVILELDPYTKEYENATMVAITFKGEDGSEKKASCFFKEDIPTWKKGDEVELDFFNSEKNDPKTAKPYLNFKLPEKEEELDI